MLYLITGGDETAFLQKTNIQYWIKKEVRKSRKDTAILRQLLQKHLDILVIFVFVITLNDLCLKK